jgi:hypothetical protein
MKRALKILYVVLIVVVVLAAAAVISVGLFANSALKFGIETAGTKALNVGVKVGEVDLSILGGSLDLENLVIDNPPGYQHKTLLELGQGRVAVDIGSLLSDTVNIKEVKLDSVNVTLEQRGISGNNLQDIIKSLPKGEVAEEKPKEAEPSGKKLRIGTLELTNVTVKAKLLPVPGKADTVTLKLAPIVMKDLGGEEKVDVAKLSAKILRAIAKGVAEQGAGVLPDDMTSAMKTTLSETMELGKTAAEEGRKAIEEGTGAGKKIIEGLGGLLKKKEEE